MKQNAFGFKKIIFHSCQSVSQPCFLGDEAFFFFFKASAFHWLSFWVFINGVRGFSALTTGSKWKGHRQRSRPHLVHLLFEPQKRQSFKRWVYFYTETVLLRTAGVSGNSALGQQQTTLITLPSLGCSRDMLGATQLLPPTWSDIEEESWKRHFHSGVVTEEVAGKPEFEGVYQKRKESMNKMRDQETSEVVSVCLHQGFKLSLLCDPFLPEKLLYNPGCVKQVSKIDIHAKLLLIVTYKLTLQQIVALFLKTESKFIY